MSEYDSGAREYGKAFSVMASEVRTLSDITKRAAEEINELASSSVEVAENAGQMLADLVPNIHKTAELVQEISAASHDSQIFLVRFNNKEVLLIKPVNADMANDMTIESIRVDDALYPEPPDFSEYFGGDYLDNLLQFHELQ